MSQMKRSRSTASVNYGGHVDRFHKLAGPTGLRRVSSLPHLADLTRGQISFQNYRERASPYLRYYREWDVWDDYWYDKRYHTSPVYWPYAAWPNRRYHNLDPPQSLWMNYPTLSWYPKRNRYAFVDQIDPAYWRRYRDPHYDRPLYYPYRPWVYESMDTSRAMKLYEQNMISYDTLEKYWLAPRPWESRWSDYKPPYRPPTWYTSPRRYFYTNYSC